MLGITEGSVKGVWPGTVAQLKAADGDHRLGGPNPNGVAYVGLAT